MGPRCSVWKAQEVWTAKVVDRKDCVLTQPRALACVASLELESDQRAAPVRGLDLHDLVFAAVGCSGPVQLGADRDSTRLSCLAGRSSRPGFGKLK